MASCTRADLVAKVDVPCELCKMVGRSAADSHLLKDCFANPENPNCKPKVYRARLQDLAYRGLPIPAYMCKPPPPEKPDAEHLACEDEAEPSIYDRTITHSQAQAILAAVKPALDAPGTVRMGELLEEAAQHVVNGAPRPHTPAA